ncbi:hypothetical protein NHP21005_05400 [Helicobacter sp. NHP21005]|uniref:glycosyltransferase n=1 Tax=Helicobacter felistomachi TaxID=3040201 RepID=UPI0025734B95|nr:glycosyltransferase [Helicobacter sp. NHP21005]BEG56852.1 hypothetical protein NHP21005_05400 [Helicobacter sp. NHP21005]
MKSHACTFRNTHFKSVSLIITTYNQEQHLKMVLDSVLNLACLPSEVLIADDGGRGTQALMARYQPLFAQKNLPLRHVWQEDLGFRAAKNRNNAIEEAMGEYIIVIDTDMILSPMFVYDHMHFARPKVLAQGGRILLNPKESQRILECRDFSLAYAKKSLKNRRILSLAKLIYKHRKVTKKIFNTRTIVPGVRSCNMGFSKQDCLDIAGFNENFVGWGREDSEFVARFLFNHGTLKPLKFCPRLPLAPRGKRPQPAV